MAQSVERVLGKDEVTGSNPVSSSKKRTQAFFGLCSFFMLYIKNCALRTYQGKDEVTGSNPVSSRINIKGILKRTSHKDVSTSYW